MTTKQIQCLLTYLGYNPGQIDGIDGKKTQAALAAFRADYGVGEEGLVGAVAGTVAKTNRQEQAAIPSGAEKYLQADGFYHIPRGVNVQLSKNLWSREVCCQGKGCCQESIINPKMVELFQIIRDDYGEAIPIGDAGGSGFRCKIRNTEEGGAASSLHLTGSAFDMHPKNVSKLLTIVKKKLTDGEYGVYPWGIHVGVWNKGYVSQFR